jgi:hypothetical protein
MILGSSHFSFADVAMSSASSTHRESIPSSLYTRLQRLFRSDRIAPSVSGEAGSSRVEAAQTALAQAMSPAERVHAIHQAQAAGLPFNEIEEQLDWSDARAAAGVK